MKLVIVWRVTGYCNLACAFCGYSRSLDRPRSTAHPEQVLAFGQVLRDYAVASRRDILVSWLGGEPLLWPPLAELTRTFKHRFGLRVSVTTNGTTLGASAAREQIIADYDEITLSLDGVGRVHDQVRGAPGLYEQLGANVAALRGLAARRGRGLLVRVNTILMRDNIYELESLCRSLAAWGVQALTLNTLGGRERPEFYPNHRLLPEHVEWLRQALPGIRQRAAQLGLRICGSPAYLERLVRTARAQPMPVADCAPGRDFLFIDESGLVSPCSFTIAGYGVPLSEIETADDLARLPARFAARRKDQPQPACADCHCTEVLGKFN